MTWNIRIFLRDFWVHALMETKISTSERCDWSVCANCKIQWYLMISTKANRTEAWEKLSVDKQLRKWRTWHPTDTNVNYTVPEELINSEFMWPGIVIIYKIYMWSHSMKSNFNHIKDKPRTPTYVHFCADNGYFQFCRTTTDWISKRISVQWQSMYIYNKGAFNYYILLLHVMVHSVLETIHKSNLCLCNTFSGAKAIEFFRIEFYGKYRIYRICRTLFAVIFILKFTKNNII